MAQLLANCHHCIASNLKCGKIQCHLWSGNMIFYCQTNVLLVAVHHSARMTSSGEPHSSQGLDFTKKIPEDALKSILAHGSCLTKSYVRDLARACRLGGSSALRNGLTSQGRATE